MSIPSFGAGHFRSLYWKTGGIETERQEALAPWTKAKEHARRNVEISSQLGLRGHHVPPSLPTLVLMPLLYPPSPLAKLSSSQ